MKGFVQRIWEDDNYEFKGVIEAEDGQTYGFNKRNWQDPALSVADIEVGCAVEFELKPPNANGYIFPKRVRFAGEAIVSTNTFVTKHSHGDFKNFVYVKIGSIAPALTALVGETFDSNQAFRMLATHYNDLNDADFCFNSDDAGDWVLVPTNYASLDGSAIYLYCTPNPEPDKATWICEKISCGGALFGGSIFDIVNANWYDLRSGLKDYAKDVPEDVTEIVQNIETRCLQISAALVWLNKGQPATEATADYLYVPTGYFNESEQEIYMSCSKQNGLKGYGWYYDCMTYENAPIEVFDKKDWLDLWAEFDGRDIFPKLANKTLEEKWSFRERNDYGILRNYLIYTFAHQWKEGAVGISSDGRYAAFNTGLPDRSTYKYIYAFFEAKPDLIDGQHHPLHPVQKYRFKDFVLQDRGGDGKTLTSEIRPLPAPPKYFEARSATVWELDFNESNQLSLPGYDDAHILIHRCDRLPLEFYRKCALDCAEIRQILDEDGEEDVKYKKIREFFKPIMDEKAAPDANVTEAYSRLEYELRNTITRAVQKLSWNWRGVVPCYNPEQEKSCFLLPASFASIGKPDRALIASVNTVNDEVLYRIETVIPLDWAYLDARLVCRPESEWLALETIN